MNRLARLALGVGVACSAPTAPAMAAGYDAASLYPAMVRRIDGAIRAMLVDDDTPSASVAVVLDGRVVFSAAYGVARADPPQPATPGTRYQLASLSKMLTAQAVLLLEQDGKLSLDDHVSRWLPGITQANQVTVRELLNHTAGYPDHYPQTYPAGPRRLPTTADRLIAEWGHHKLLFSPGSQFHYSNMNYVIAGRIVELVSGESLFGFLKARIFVPAGMADTVDLDDIDGRTPDVAMGYVRPALAVLQAAPEEGRGWSFGAGQVVTAARDMARWDAAFLAGALLKPRQAEEEVTPPTLADGRRSDYALGLFVSHSGGRTVYSHVGQGLGFLAVNRIYPDERAAIVVLTNSSSSLAFRHIADRLEYLVIPPTPQDAQARAIFTAIQRGRPPRGQFTGDFNAYFDSVMARHYASSLAPLGEPVSFVLHGEDVADGITTRTYDVVADGRHLRVLHQLAPDGMTEDFNVQEATR